MCFLRFYGYGIIMSYYFIIYQFPAQEILYIRITAYGSNSQQGSQERKFSFHSQCKTALNPHPTVAFKLIKVRLEANL